MKNIIIISLLIFSISVKSQEKKYSYYLYLDNFNNAPSFNVQNGLLNYVGVNSQLSIIFNKYKIYNFNQAFPEFIDSNSILNVFLVVCNSNNLINELMQAYPLIFLSYNDLTDKNIETLYYPNDYGNTSPIVNLGANVNRKELDYQKANQAWNITTGVSSIVLGISDSNFDSTSPDLAGKLNFVSGYNGQYTGWAHGTGVTALAAAKGNNSSGSVGVCMDCNILAAPIGIGTISQIAFSSLYKLANEGARVINMSWHNGMGYQNGLDGYRPVEQEVINYLVDKFNVIFVGAAGNNPSFSQPNSSILPGGVGPYGIIYIYPASYDNVISVSSINHKNTQSLPLNTSQSSYCCTSPLFPVYLDLEDSVSHSSNGIDPMNPISVLRNGYYISPTNIDGFQWSHTLNDKVDILSTGYDVFDYSGFLNSINLYANGTSFSAPIVTGTIGLMLSVNSCLLPVEVESILKLSTKDIENLPINQNYLPINQPLYSNFDGFLGAGKLEIGDSVDFVNQMIQPNGNAIIDNHIFNRFNFKLEKINNILTINNIVFRDKNTSDFTSKNEINITNSDFRPNSNGYVNLKINPSITICPTSPKNPNPLINNNETKFKSNLLNDFIKLFPNPNKGIFTISLYRDFKDLSVKVYDVFGKLVYSNLENSSNFEINISSLPSAMYFVKLNSNELNETLKVIKE